MLLRLLVDEARREGFHPPRAGKKAVVVAAHLDHGLRPDSGDQAAAASRAAAALGVRCVVERRDVAERVRREAQSVQEAAREVRLAFLAETAGARGLAAVALGHTRSDQAETLLLRLARGSGTGGLSAMAPARPMPGPGAPLLLLRPLLGVSRSEIDALVQAEGWPVAEDPSNRDLRFARNRLRQGALARLRDEINPAAETALARAATLLRDDEEWLAARAKEVFRELASRDGAGTALPAAGLVDLPPAISRRVVRLALEQVRGRLQRIGLVHVEDVLRLARAGRGGASLDLPGVTVRLQEGFVRFALPSLTQNRESATKNGT